MSSPGQTFDGPTVGTTKPRKGLGDKFKLLFNPKYFKSFHFILRVALILLCAAGAISVSVLHSTKGASQYYNFVVVSAIVIALIQIFIHFAQITKKFEKIPWSFVELIIDIVWAILILIAAAIVASQAGGDPSYAAGAFFGFAVLLLFVVDGIFNVIRILRGGRHKSDGPPEPVAPNPPQP